MGLFRVTEAEVGSRDLVDLLNHKEDHLNEVLDDLHVVFTKFDTIFILFEPENYESAFKFFFRSVFTANDILRVRVSAFRLLEALVEFNILIDGASDEVTDLSRHKSSNRVAEVFGLLLVKVIKLFSQDVSSRFAPFRTKESSHVIGLSLLEGVEFS